MLQQQLERAIELHKKMKLRQNKYSPSTPNKRRAYEIRNSSYLEFSFMNKFYKVIQETNCEFDRIYYSMTIFENGVVAKKGISFLEKVMNAA